MAPFNLSTFAFTGDYTHLADVEITDKLDHRLVPYLMSMEAGKPDLSLCLSDANMHFFSSCADHHLSVVLKPTIIHKTRHPHKDLVFYFMCLQKDMSKGALYMTLLLARFPTIPAFDCSLGFPGPL